jgi:hypothetical protein
MVGYIPRVLGFLRNVASRIEPSQRSRREQAMVTRY